MQETKAGTRIRVRSLILPLALLGSVLGSCAPKAGTGVPLPVRGDTVRVTTAGITAIHEFRALQGDVLVVEHGDSLFRLPLASIDRWEALVGHRTQVGNAIGGAVGGFLVGAAVGAGFAALIVSGARSCEGWMCELDAIGPAIAAATVCVVAGTGTGMALGLDSPTGPVWAPVRSTALAVQARPLGGGIGVQLSWWP